MEKEGSKREGGPELDKYGGKLRLIVVSHDTTDQVTKYRGAPTRKMRVSTEWDKPPERDNISEPPQYNQTVTSERQKKSAEEERRRASMERAAEIRKRSAAEYEFRMATGARLTAVWKKQRERNSDSTERAPALTASEKHHEDGEVEPGQVMITPSDIRPIYGTKEKTLRALAIHVVENQLTGPYADIDPEGVNAMGKPGEMMPARVEFTLGRGVIPVIHNKCT